MTQLSTSAWTPSIFDDTPKRFDADLNAVWASVSKIALQVIYTLQHQQQQLQQPAPGCSAETEQSAVELALSEMIQAFHAAWMWHTRHHQGSARMAVYLYTMVTLPSLFPELSWNIERPCQQIVRRATGHQVTRAECIARLVKSLQTLSDELAKNLTNELNKKVSAPAANAPTSTVPYNPYANMTPEQIAWEKQESVRRDEERRATNTMTFRKFACGKV